MEYVKEMLQKFGLTDNQVKIYLTIVQNKSISIAKLSVKTGIKRTNVYHIIEELIKIGLVKQDNGKIKSYSLNNPSALQEIAANKEAELKKANSLFELAFPQLQKLYALQTSQPYISYLEGLSGLSAMYNEIFNSGVKSYDIFRSYLDNSTPDVYEVLKKAVIKQIKKKIKVRIIGPLTDKTEQRYKNTDKLNLIERRIVPQEFLQLASQFIIWGDNCAIVSYEENLVITIIRNKSVAKSMQAVFDYCWIASENHHKNIVKEWA